MATIAIQSFGTKGKTLFIIGNKQYKFQIPNSAIYNGSTKSYSKGMHKNAKTISLKRYWVLTFKLINIFVCF